MERVAGNKGGGKHAVLFPESSCGRSEPRKKPRLNRPIAGIASFFQEVHPKEITMTENKRFEGDGAATSHAGRRSRFWHWTRVAVSFMSGGFIFPHALTEDDEPDIAAPHVPEDAGVKNP